MTLSKVIVGVGLWSMVVIGALASEFVKPPRFTPIPVAVDAVELVHVCLDGTWMFNPKPDASFVQQVASEEWSPINVPGEWVMQGFQVATNQAAGYMRSFEVPKDWVGKRVKLRFDAVYSDAVVYVNGVEVGRHEGGFTPFELDITDVISFGDTNHLALQVTSESLADQLASGSKYACHALGGIPRSVHLFVVPSTYVQDVVVQTTFDDAFEDAELEVSFRLQGEVSSDIRIQYELSPYGEPDQESVLLGSQTLNASAGKMGSVIKESFSVKAPKKWDCEQPNLYQLTCTLYAGETMLQKVSQRFGFRTTEVVGNQLLINGKPVTLRGVNRHEVYPTTGRSIPKELYRKDVELFRDANVNLIRTSHYPPDQALMEAADELGMLIECEGPFCWSHETKGDAEQIRELIVGQNVEMVAFYRNHPSIIYWSIANESHWSDDYAAAGEAMKELDPTRPLTFNYFPWGDTYHTQDEPYCAIGTDHYPGFKGIEKFKASERPIYYGEYAHLNAYNRYELATDVALRAVWGTYLHQMWEEMVATESILGGSIWAGIDDTFFIDVEKEDGSIEEHTVGYGMWGPLDGWRRCKPEYWGMKKTYSPIRVSNLRKEGDQWLIDVENRQDFSNLNRLRMEWKVGEQKGVTQPDVPPKAVGTVALSLPTALVGNQLELCFEDPRGFMVDRFLLPFNQSSAVKDGGELELVSYTVTSNEQAILIQGGASDISVDRTTGLLQSGGIVGPHLMLLPLNNEGETQMKGPSIQYEPYTSSATGWDVSSVEVDDGGEQVSVKVCGAYDEAAGHYQYTFLSDGRVSIEYAFTLTTNSIPRQVGVVFDVPKKYETLSWDRKGYWTTYPEWHIARLKGTASASEGEEVSPLGPRSEPQHEWRMDRTPIGSHDFASTKHTVYSASLTDASGHGIYLCAEADQHVRAWNEKGGLRLLIAYYSNGGSERFLHRLTNRDYLRLKAGDTVGSEIIIRINP